MDTNLARMFLIQCYLMLQNSRVTAFTVLELLRENQLEVGGGVKLPPPLHPTRLGLIQIEEKTQVQVTVRSPDYAFNEIIHIYCFHEWDVFLIHLFNDRRKN